MVKDLDIIYGLSFEKGIIKMAGIDIDPFGEHESRTEEPTDENICLDPVTPGRSSTWEPESKKLHLEENLKKPN